MSSPSLDLRTHKPHSFGTQKTNVQIICKDDTGPDYTFDADGYILRAVSGRFERLLEGVNLVHHNRKNEVPDNTSTVSSISTSTLASSLPAAPHLLIVKESGQRMLLLLQFINYAPLLPFLPSNRFFSGRELLTLLELAESYKLKDAPRATLKTYIAKSAQALVMQVVDYDGFRALVSLLESTRCVVLARAFFRLDWDNERVLLLHLHHLAQPWDMPDEVIAALSPDIFNALVYVETERAIWGERITDLQVTYSRAQIAFTWLGRENEHKVAFGDDVPTAGRFFRR